MPFSCSCVARQLSLSAVALPSFLSDYRLSGWLWHCKPWLRFSKICSVVIGFDCRGESGEQEFRANSELLTLTKDTECHRELDCLGAWEKQVQRASVFWFLLHEASTQSGDTDTNLVVVYSTSEINYLTN